LFLVHESAVGRGPRYVITGSFQLTRQSGIVFGGRRCAVT